MSGTTPRETLLKNMPRSCEDDEALERAADDMLRGLYGEYTLIRRAPIERYQRCLTQWQRCWTQRKRGGHSKEEEAETALRRARNDLLIELLEATTARADGAQAANTGTQSGHTGEEVTKS